MICFPVTRHVGGCRVSARKAWGHHVATARRRFEREDMSVRDAASLGSRAVPSAVRPDEARGGRKAPSRGRPAREENIWGRRKRGVCAPARPPHRTAWWTKPGAVSGRALSADSVPCAGSEVLAREGSRGLFLRQKSPPPPLAAADETFHVRALIPPRRVAVFCKHFGSRFKRERAPRVGHYRSFDRARGVSKPGHENAIACISGVRSRRVSHRPRLKRRRAIARAKHGASRVFDALDAPRLRSRNAGLHLTPALFLHDFPSSRTRRANVNPANRLPRRWRPRWTPCSRARSATTTRR